ncbi:hypothetical protein NPA31_004355 [Aurantimonas sp. MSK8Z-1]|uniref:hypothetical protein n=1 Tax=Mangrovibrevibacter kandeliae TaxID=2968473 RepID=UPI002117C0D2|nr:hypothetical protein [Aurantimonas sp. MSK8Z-1]MCW4114196.1 hypothetical protein [Aurantimonas sp. MSK8Z-1]
MRISLARRVVAGSLLLAALSSSTALAADADAFGTRLKDVAAKQGLTVTYTGTEASGDDVVLKGLAVVDNGETATLGDITFEGVTGSDAEGWTVKRVPFDDIDVTKDDVHTVANGMVIEGLQIAGTGAKTVAPVYFDRAAVANVAIEEAGEQVFTLEGTEITNSADGDGYATDFNLGSFNADFTAGKSDEGAEVMKELGYPQLSGSISGSGSWNPKSGELTLDPLEIDVPQAGTFTFSYLLGGYTPSFIQSLAQIQQQMMSNPESNQASGMAILGLISQLNLGSLELAYVDHSLTPKLLDYYAKQNGQSHDELVQSLTGALPMVLGYLQNPEFQQQVTDAVTTFLNDPQSLTISIDPDKPVPATQIIGAAMGAPQTLPTVLQLQVTANDADAE